MTLRNITFFCLLWLVFLLAPVTTKAQECDIPVSSIVKKATKGKNDGSIEISIKSEDTQQNRYKVFVVNLGPERAKQELKDRILNNVGKGFYDFLIIDLKNDKCVKEITVTIDAI